MARYIDADKLKLSLLTLQNTLKACDLINGVRWVQALIDALDVTPTADVAEVKHGKWDCIEDFYGDYYRCSVCNGEFILEEGSPEQNDYNYCPACGAKMDRDENAHKYTKTDKVVDPSQNR